jgi:Flp pilus assembly protein TadD
MVYTCCLSHICGYVDWQLHEEVAIAAFSCGLPAIGREVLKKLQEKFKGSNRVECLRGMAYESIGKLEEAETIYDTMLASKPTYPDALKRKVC